MDILLILGIGVGAGLTAAAAALGALRGSKRRRPRRRSSVPETGQPVGGRVMPIGETTISRFYFPNDRKRTRIGLITGRIINVKDVDVWVNGENTDMEMSRPKEFSVSAIIRNYGARRDDAGRLVHDTIYDELRKAVGRLEPVEPGTVFVTTAGELRASNGVSRIIHVAAVQGESGAGFRQVQNVGLCVKNALATTDELVRDGELPQDDKEHPSILIPLLGTGMGGANVEETVQELVDAAISYVGGVNESAIQEIYFLAYAQRDLDALLNYLRSSGRLVENLT
jgi:O-acetyl-ADP-ribose deacetylase (regulator of RNase III)